MYWPTWIASPALRGDAKNCENILCNQQKALFHKIKQEWFFSKLKKPGIFPRYSSKHEGTGKFPRNILWQFQKISENFSFQDMNERESFQEIFLESSRKFPRIFLLKTWMNWKVSAKSYFESLKVLENFREIFF